MKKRDLVGGTTALTEQHFLEDAKDVLEGMVVVIQASDLGKASSRGVVGCKKEGRLAEDVLDI